MNVLMKNERIQLVRTEKKDLPFVVETEREQENAKYVGQWSLERHAEALDDADILHLLIQKTDGQTIGYAIIRGLTNPNDSIELMRIAIADKGAGYGKQAISLIRRWCFDVRRAHRLWLDVREHNLRAQHVYRTQGFVPEGVLRECVKVGDTYQSLVVMSILRQDDAAR